MNPIQMTAASALVLLIGCSSLSPEDEIRLNTFKYNSKKFYEDGQFQRAENACRRGLDLDPDDLSLRQVLAFSLLRQGSAPQVAESVVQFEECLDLENDDYRSYLGLGEAQFQLGLLWSNRIAALRVDEKMTPDEREDEIARAESGRDGAYAGSEAALKTVLESTRGRDNVVAQSTLARLYAILERFQESADVLRTMNATLARSRELRTEQIDPETIPEDRRALFARMLTQLRDQEVEGLGLLAAVAAKMKHWDEVISVYARVELLDAMQPADYYNRARAFEGLRSRDAAVLNYETFVRKAAGQGAAFSEAVGEAMRRAAQLRDGGEFLVDP